jgi:hypothetical protein
MLAQDPRTGTAGPHEDLWRAIGLPGVMRVASYLTENLAPVYRLIVDVMLEHQPQYLSGIPHDQLEIFIRDRLVQHLIGDDQTLAAVLSPNALNLDNRLAQLAGWGVIHRPRAPGRSASCRPRPDLPEAFGPGRAPAGQREVRGRRTAGPSHRPAARRRRCNHHRRPGRRGVRDLGRGRRRARSPVRPSARHGDRSA